MSAITKEYLDQSFVYNRGTGEFIRKDRPREHFGTDRQWNAFNARRSGTDARSFRFKKNGKPHIVTIDVGYKRLCAHRAAWIMEHGDIPAGMVIDHINGDPHDNRISNLRVCSQADNCKNRHPKNSKLTHGVMGVVFLRDHAWHKKPWRASLSQNKKLVFIGAFATKAEAAVAYAKASLRYCGEFSPFYRKPTPHVTG